MIESRNIALLVPTLLLCLVGCNPSSSPSNDEASRATGGKTVKLLNVSYDPTREFYVEFNKTFAKHWKEKTGDTVEIDQSHGGRASKLGR